jgi:hypothetical protein
MNAKKGAPSRKVSPPNAAARVDNQRVTADLGKNRLGAETPAIGLGKAPEQKGNGQPSARSTAIAQGEPRPGQVPSPTREAAVPIVTNQNRKDASAATGAAKPAAVGAVAKAALPSASGASQEQRNSIPRREGFTELFNGQDLTGWSFHPSRASAWSIKDGVIVGRGPRRGHLFTNSGDFTNFHVRFEAKINAGGNAGFCFRVPQIIDGQLIGSGFEVNISATNSNWKAPRLMELGRWGNSRTALAPANDWFVLEAIAVGRRILVLVNGGIIVNLYDQEGRFNRGHFALHHVDPNTEVQVRAVEVRSLELGNDALKIASGGQPVARVSQSLGGKSYMVFDQPLPWADARLECISLGGRLALPSDEEANQFLTKMAKGKGIEAAWLGASDPNFLGEWRALDGSELRYSNWDQDAAPPIVDLNQRYYPLLVVGRDGKWVREPNLSRDYRTAYICQWD